MVLTNCQTGRESALVVLSRAGKGGLGALSWFVAVVLALHSAAN